MQFGMHLQLLCQIRLCGYMGEGGEYAPLTVHQARNRLQILREEFEASPMLFGEGAPLGSL